MFANEDEGSKITLLNYINYIGTPHGGHMLTLLQVGQKVPVAIISSSVTILKKLENFLILPLESFIFRSGPLEGYGFGGTSIRTCNCEADSSTEKTYKISR